MALNDQEKNELLVLLDKIDNNQIRGEIWHQLVKKIITVPVELCIIDDLGRVLLIYRKDREFDGYHIPGSVLNDWENVDAVLDRLVQEEVFKGVGITITRPEPVGWFEFPKDGWPDGVTIRHGVSLLYIAHLKGSFTEKKGIGFYFFNSLPENTLECHKFILPYFEKYCKTGELVLGR